MEDEAQILNIEYPKDLILIILEDVHEFLLKKELPVEVIKLILIQLVRLNNQHDNYLFVIHVSEEKATLNFYIKIPLLDLETFYPLTLMVTFPKVLDGFDCTNEPLTKLMFLTRRFIQLFIDLELELRTREGMKDIYIDGNKLDQIEIITPEEFSELKNPKND